MVKLTGAWTQTSLSENGDTPKSQEVAATGEVATSEATKHQGGVALTVGAWRDNPIDAEQNKWSNLDPARGKEGTGSMGFGDSTGEEIKGQIPLHTFFRP